MSSYPGVDHQSSELPIEAPVGHGESLLPDSDVRRKTTAEASKEAALRTSDTN